MAHECTNCDDDLDAGDVRYERRTADSSDVELYCSLNCLAATSEFDESAVRDRLFGVGSTA